MYRRFKSATRVNTVVPLMENNEDVAHGSYGALLFDKRWKTRRKDILIKDQYRCVVCQNSQELQVHHRQYHYYKTMKKFKAPWDYADKLLITLCGRCHQKGHNKFKVPIIYI